MQRFIILHSNDIHGHIDGLARTATLVEQTCAENPDIHMCDVIEDYLKGKPPVVVEMGRLNL